jgi:hypothetical protein
LPAIASIIDTKQFQKIHQQQRLLLIYKILTKRLSTTKKPHPAFPFVSKRTTFVSSLSNQLLSKTVLKNSEQR